MDGDCFKIVIANTHTLYDFERNLNEKFHGCTCAAWIYDLMSIFITLMGDFEMKYMAK